MIVVYIICGITLVLAGWSAWSTYQNTQTIHVLTEMASHFGALYETQQQIVKYLSERNE